MKLKPYKACPFRISWESRLVILRPLPGLKRGGSLQTALYVLKLVTMQRNSPTWQGSVVYEYRSHEQQTPTREHGVRSPPPPPYTPTTDQTTTAKVYDLSSNTKFKADDLSSISSEDGSNSEHPLPLPTNPSGEAYTGEPPMSTDPENPWSKYDDTPGCCCSTTGGCCFSSRGGCCFSDTEGCCFSTTKGCCFSSDAACCFSNHNGSLFPFGKVCMLLLTTRKELGC